MERHVADKLGIQLRLETTHMAAGQRTEREKEGRQRRKKKKEETVTFSVILCPHKLVSGAASPHFLYFRVFALFQT